jgi:peptidoglycan/xylan/chitin deacetylase (PgdA/CDA1 family)
VPGATLGPNVRDLIVESVYEYGSRSGFWRLMRMFGERDIPITVFGAALALERNPEAAAAIRAAGYEVCCHGWRWINFAGMPIEEERAQMRRAIASLEATIGERPYGWYCRYAPSENTRALVVEDGGFLYDSDAYNDDLPYWTRVGEKPHLVIPYTLDNNDMKFSVPPGFTSGDGFFSYLKDAFDVLYAEGATHPKMMSVGLHTRLVGRPGRARALERFLDYILGFPDVWIARRIDIARHWIATFPADA